MNTDRMLVDAVAAGARALADGLAKRSAPAPVEPPAWLRCEEAVRIAATGRDWLWEGWIACGSSTLIVANPKDGKSTLVYGLIGALERSEKEFVGLPIKGTSAVVLSEEAEADIAEKVVAFGLRDAEILPRKYAALYPFPVAMGHAVERARALGAKLIVVDSYAYWGQFPEGGENDPSVVTGCHRSVISPACAEGFAVVVLHHAKKDGKGRDVNAAIRGSGAIAANFEINALLRLKTNRRDPRRVLIANGRPQKAPDELNYELRDGEFRALDEKSALPDPVSVEPSRSPDNAPRHDGEALRPSAPVRDAEARMLDAVRRATHAQATAKGLCALAGIAPRRGRAALASLVESGAILSTGRGKKGSARLYHQAPEEDAA